MKHITTALFLLFVTVVFSQDKIPVFTAGSEGYKSFRIPAIIRLPNGNLLAFCEGRLNGSNDFGNIDIMMKRSADGGKTWSIIEKVVDFDTLQAGNPAPVVDLTDKAYPGGRIFLFYNTGTRPEEEIRKGRGVREVWYKTSADNGKSWSEPVNITMQVHHPKQPQAKAAYNFAEDWRWFANTPGHAMQFAGGRYKGRIFVATNHSVGNPKQQFVEVVANGFYTRDHGKTFYIGGDIQMQGSSESMAAELSKNKLLMTSRNQKGDVKTRIMSVSSKGGSTWDKSYYDTTLTDPVCQGSILPIGKKSGKNIIAFCNPANKYARNHLTLRISFDEGVSWTKQFVVDDENEFTSAAYSDIVKLSPSKVGVLYEKNSYKQIVFSAVKWK